MRDDKDYAAAYKLPRVELAFYWQGKLERE
jgi:hypothetical protein